MRMPRLWHGNMVASYEDLLNLEERMGIVNRGATTEIIERNTLPHKYKKLKVNWAPVLVVANFVVPITIILNRLR